MKSKYVVTIVIVGLVLLILPWVQFPGAMTAPSEFGTGHSTYIALGRLAGEVDKACKNGDVSGVEGRITEDFRAELVRRLAGTGKDITPLTLRDTQVLIGELRGQDFRLGRADADRAVLIFRQRSYAGSQAERGGRGFLYGVLFAWDGHRFLVDRTRSSTLAALGESEVQGAERLARELLESRPEPR